MGIFNEHSNNNPFARGIQGAPGVGFHLTSDGDYDMVGKKLTNVGAPTFNTDAATKKYVDDNNSSFPTVLSTNLVVDSDIDMKDKYRIRNLKASSDADDVATKQYTDINFFYRDASHPITGDVNMTHHKIENLANPTSDTDATNKTYVDTTVMNNKVDGTQFLKLDGTRKMAGTLDMNNNPIWSLPMPTEINQPTTKINSDRTYLKLDGTNSMGNI